MDVRCYLCIGQVSCCFRRYRLSPYTYLIEGLTGQGTVTLKSRVIYWLFTILRCFSAVGRKPLVCAQVELVSLDPPFGQTCQEYLQTYINHAGGYVTNPTATSNCQFCAYATTDQFLESTFNIFYSHHWRNFGIFIAYVVMNVGSVIFFSLKSTLTLIR